MTDTDREQKPLEDFTGFGLDVLNKGMLALMWSIGYNAGLFDALAEVSPASGNDIARAAGLDERYVREWLAAVVAGGIVSYDPTTASYALPAEHAELLSSDAGANNLAGFASTIQHLARVEGDIIGCFRGGGGVPYEKFADFLLVWSRLKQHFFENSLLSEVVPLVPEVDEALRRGVDVLEIGCGEGYPTSILGAAYSGSRFVAQDFRKEAIDVAIRRIERTGSSNVRYEVKDLNTLDSVDAFDVVLAFDVIHDQRDPRRVLRNVSNALRPNGVFLMVDIKASSCLEKNADHPLGPFLYGTSLMHCMTVSLALQGEGLGTMWGEELALELLHEAGFDDVRVGDVASDPFNSYYVARRG